MDSRRLPRSPKEEGDASDTIGSPFSRNWCRKAKSPAKRLAGTGGFDEKRLITGLIEPATDRRNPAKRWSKRITE